MELPVVAIVGCDDYEYETVGLAVNRGLELLGGADQFARKGERILLKPNLLAADPPERCVTTHPAVFRAVAEVFLNNGVKLLYGDSPGFGGFGKAAHKSGLAAVAEELGIDPGNFSEGVRIPFSEGIQNKSFVIARAVTECQGIISLPKLKSHGLTTLTGAIKNQFGCIPGLLKGEFHAKLPEMRHFLTMLAELTQLIKPRLYVMDAVLAMEGNGPRSGKPRKIGALLLSADPVALDATAARMVGLLPDTLDIIRIGQQHGLGCMDKESIVLLGDALASFITTDFEISRASTMARLSNHHLRNILVQRPEIQDDDCIHCGICVQVCPVTPKALQWSGQGEGEEGVQPPVYNYDRCIRCYCCQELCPQGAIKLVAPVLGQALNILKPPVS